MKPVEARSPKRNRIPSSAKLNNPATPLLKLASAA
ncbi:hypothetical protein D049_1812A, partial [Vibrio parahaemolyticus VPTS-2010]